VKRAAIAAALLVATSLASAQAPSATACAPDPLGGRALYLRGTFNSWNTVDTQRFAYICNRFELVTALAGAHTFKVGDDEWSKDADFGAKQTAPGKPWQLSPKGSGIHYTFQGMHRIVLKMSPTNNPTLSITTCPPPPLGETTLFLRGSMSNWTALDAFAFTYSCDAYYLNVKLKGQHEFKIADAAWTSGNTLGGSNGAPATAKFNQALPIAKGTSAADVGNLYFGFDGEQTLRVVFAGGLPLLTISAKSFADPNEQAITDPVALSLRHDSRALAHKAPFGAVPAGTTVNFAMTAQSGVRQITLVLEKRRLEGNQDVLEYTEVARVPMARSGQTDHERWAADYMFRDVSIYGYYFEAIIGDKTFIYQNNRQPIFWTREKGANGLGLVGDIAATVKPIRRFRHTVHARDFTVPAWGRDAIYYYIFPDRFRNGTTKNDQRPGIDTYQDKGIECHRNWLDKPWKPGSGDGSDDVPNNDFFGGDIAGIIEKLDYIAALGANALYITPVFRASSNHKYDTADFKNIDPHLGTNADFESLTTEAHKRGIRVIPDTSLNHVGSDSIYFDRFGKYHRKGAFEGAKVRRDSPYSDWFTFDETQADPNRQFKGWAGVLDLPELNKASPAYREYAFGAPDSVMKLWLDRGAAGWRMDVAPWVPDDFWREWRTAIKRHKPDALTIAETWFDASKYFLGDTFDSTMNYIFRNTVLEYAGGGKARQLYPNLELIREVYPAQAVYALMNLLSTHDVARSLHVFGYESEATDEEMVRIAKQRLRLAAFFQMTYPGAPTIYYGDEVGVTGGEDPYNRGPYPWTDKGGKPDAALLADFKRLIKMRKYHAVLRHGTIDAPVHIDDNVIVLVRCLGDIWAITATNNAMTSKSVTVKLPVEMKAQTLLNALTGSRVSVAAGAITLDVPALYGTALISE
jgi:cyclomaltodextrinase / maltogenic alpha-amylase / neopullulanase